MNRVREQPCTTAWRSRHDSPTPHSAEFVMSRYLWLMLLAAALVGVTTVGAQQQPGREQGDGEQGRGRGKGRGFEKGGEGGFRIRFGGEGGEGGGRGGEGGGRGGPGGRSAIAGDPNQFFDFLSQGKDTIRRDDLNPGMQRMFD